MPIKGEKTNKRMPGSRKMPNPIHVPKCISPIPQHPHQSVQHNHSNVIQYGATSTVESQSNVQYALTSNESRKLCCYIDTVLVLKHDKISMPCLLNIPDINLTTTLDNLPSLTRNESTMVISEWLCSQFLKLNSIVIDEDVIFHYPAYFNMVDIQTKQGCQFLSSTTCALITYPDPNTLNVSFNYDVVNSQTYVLNHLHDANSSESLNQQNDIETYSQHSQTENLYVNGSYYDLIDKLFPWTALISTAGYSFEPDSIYKCFLVNKLFQSLQIDYFNATNVLIDHVGPFFVDNIICSYNVYKDLLTSFQHKNLNTTEK